MLGAYLALSKLLPDEVVLNAINAKAHSRPGLAEFNTKALQAGKEYVCSSALRA
jgi:Pyruvate/2-oxoacid:ferredoxin oxidoreductase gamma subunit